MILFLDDNLNSLLNFSLSTPATTVNNTGTHTQTQLLLINSDYWTLNTPELHAHFVWFQYEYYEAGFVICFPVYWSLPCSSIWFIALPDLSLILTMSFGFPLYTTVLLLFLTSACMTSISRLHLGQQVCLLYYTQLNNHYYFSVVNLVNISLIHLSSQL